MRRLSNREQELASKIILNEGRNNYLGNILDSYLVQSRVDYDRMQMSAHISLIYRGAPNSIENQDLLIQKSDEVMDLIITAISLLRLLEKEGHIFLVQKSMTPDPNGGMGQAAINANLIHSSINDPEIVRLLIDYSNKQIFVTEELRVLGKNDFIPNDELRFIQQITRAENSLRTSKRALVVSATALCVTTLAFLFNTFIKTDHFPEQIMHQKRLFQNDSTHYFINQQQMDTLIKIQSKKQGQQIQKIQTSNRVPKSNPSFK